MKAKRLRVRLEPSMSNYRLGQALNNQKLPEDVEPHETKQWMVPYLHPSEAQWSQQNQAVGGLF